MVFMEGGGPGQSCAPGSSGTPLAVAGTTYLVIFEAMPTEPDVRDFLRQKLSPTTNIIASLSICLSVCLHVALCLCHISE